MHTWTKIFRSVILATVVLAAPAKAQDVWITPDLPFFEF